LLLLLLLVGSLGIDVLAEKNGTGMLNTEIVILMGLPKFIALESVQ
jgi:hypothetical protein